MIEFNSVTETLTSLSFQVRQFAVIAVAILLLGAAAIALASRFSFDLFSGKNVSTGPVRFRRIALTASLVTFCVVLCSTIVDLVLETRGPEALGGLFAFLTAAAWLPVVFVGRQCDLKRPALLYGLLLLLEAAFLGVFFADNAVLFCLSLESSTIILFLLITGWGGHDSEPIARKFLVYNLTADMLVLIGLLGLVVAAGRMSAESTDHPRHELSYSLSSLTRDVPRLASDEIGGKEYWRHARRWMLTALIFGLAIKTPLVPFHTWFAATVSEGPLCAGLAMLGAGLRVSSYTFIRFVGPLCGELGVWGDLLVGLVVLGAVYQSLLALAHGDLRKLTAYAGLSQTSLALAGFFSQQAPGTIGAVLLTIGGGLGSTLLLFLFALLEIRFEARDLSVLGGIWRRLPHVSCALLLAVLSIVGIPGLCGFAGLFPLLGALFAFEWLSALLALIAGLIVAWALFWMLERVVFNPIDGGDILPAVDDQSASIVRSRPNDLRPAELWLIAPLIVGILFIGLRPQAVVDLVSASLRMASLSS